MSTTRENAVAEREVTHFVLNSLSSCDRFPYSFFTLFLYSFFALILILILALILIFILFCAYFICVGLDMDEN